MSSNQIYTNWLVIKVLGWKSVNTPRGMDFKYSVFLFNTKPLFHYYKMYMHESKSSFTCTTTTKNLINSCQDNYTYKLKKL